MTQFSSISTNLDLVKAVDNFPYMQEDSFSSKRYLNHYYAFMIEGVDTVLGYIPKSLIESLPWPKDCWNINPVHQTVTLMARSDATPAQRTAVISQTINALRDTLDLPVLHNHSRKCLPVYGRSSHLLLEVEKTASAIFGIVVYGAHLNCFVEGVQGLRVWVARQSMSAQFYPGMLNSTTVVPLQVGDLPDQVTIRRASQEASLPYELLQRNIVAVGSVSYFHITGEKSLKEGLLEPGIQYIYEARLEEGIIPNANSTDTERFYLLSIGQIRGALKRREFTPHSSIVLVEFMIRHGIIVPENEPYYLEIVSRLHRELEFPTAEYPLLRNTG